MPWSTSDIPNLSALHVVITGATSGLGQVSAHVLASHGAQITLAVRNLEAGEAVAASIRKTTPSAKASVRKVDLTSLASVRTFSRLLTEQEQTIDVLLNNAGVMRGPRRVTEDGFELQFGTNFLGHFALTGLLLPALSDRGRVVTVSSIEHRPGHIDFDDLMGQDSYNSRGAYQQSKLAQTVFGLELNRRLIAVQSPVISVLAHPGVAKSNLATQGANRFEALMVKIVTALIAQPTESGALPQLRASTDPAAAGGLFYGPTGRGEMRGPVGMVRPSEEAVDPGVGNRLWSIAQELTDISYLDGSLAY